MEPRPWLRQERETTVAYEAFRVYLNAGAARTLPLVCETVGKSRQLITKWSADWNWVERCRAFDVHLAEAATDGLVHDLAASRDKNLALMDKLRGLLDTRLDMFIERKQDPTVAWTRAVEAMARVEANQLIAGVKDQQRNADKIGSVMELVEKALAGVHGRPGADET